MDEDSGNISGLSVEIEPTNVSELIDEEQEPIENKENNSTKKKEKIDKIEEIKEVKEIKIEIGTEDGLKDGLKDGSDDTKIDNEKIEYNKSNNIVIGNIRKNIFIMYGIPYENIDVCIREGSYEGE